MSATLRSNISALRARRILGQTSSALSRSFERLSSGQRINRASDDAAGLSLAESLKKDVRVYGQAVRNVNDGVSLLNIADATVAELSSIVIRIRELGEQAANGTYSREQREALDEEAQALSDEFSRLTRSADFNGLRLFDGSLEGGLRLQVGYGVEGSIQSTLGQGLGSGSFSDRRTFVTETGTTGTSRAAMLGDVNGDGVLDLVTVGYATTGIARGLATVQLGRGDGTFGDKRTFAAETGSNSGMSVAAALGDVNGDGKLDLVTAGFVDNAGTRQGQVSVLIGRGDGTFGDTRTFATETGSGFVNQSQAVTLGDVNGDGVLDLVTAGAATNASQQGQATVLIGCGDGTFSGKRTYATETGSISASTSAVTLGDVNGDGVLDLVTAGQTNNGSMQGQATVLIGRGDGTFGNRRTFATETGSGGVSGSCAVSLGDVNGDGVLDLVTAGLAFNGGTRGQATMLIGRGDGTFGGKRTFATETGSVNSASLALSLGDVNGDGKLDLVTAGRGSSGTQQGQAAVLIGRGDGTFGDKHTFATETGSAASQSNAVCLGDVNGDGVLDLVTAGYANNGSRQGQASVLSAVLREGIAPILEFSLQSVADARQAMGMLDNKINALSRVTGRIGAFQSRLQAAAGTLISVRENSGAAEGRIRDADIAEESALLARTQILQQAGVAMLGQANQQPALVLQLLRV